MGKVTSQWILDLVDNITSPLNAATEAAEAAASAVNEASNMVDNLGKSSKNIVGGLQDLGKGMFFLNELKEGVDNITNSFQTAIAPGIRFEYSLAQVQAVSGLASEQMRMVSDKARDLSVAFGVDAATGAGVFTNILSQLGPELANYPDVLDSMSRNAMTLSKTMEGDLSGAINVLTSSFNAYEISKDNPFMAAMEMEKQMNIIAKSAQIGAAEVPDVAQAIKNVGVSAKNAGVSFAEVNAAIQLFGQKTIKGSEAGIALRNIMTIISAPSNDAAKMLEKLGVNMDVLQNKSIPLVDRLEALVPVMQNDLLMSRLFGRENIVAAQAIIGNTDQIRDWTSEVQNSTSATDQASIMMNTYAEQQKRMTSFVDDLKISFFNIVEPIAPVVEAIGTVVAAVVGLGAVVWSFHQIASIAAIKTSITWIASMTKIVISTVTSATAITAAISSIPIIGWIAIAVTAIGGLVAYLWNKIAEVRAFFYGLWNFIKVIFTEYYKFIFNIVKAIGEVINPANWFDSDFNFSDVWDKLSTQATEGGKKVAGAFNEGWNSGMDNWKESHKTQSLDSSNKKSEVVIPALNQDTQFLKKNSSYSSESGSSSRSGSSPTTKNITMTVNMSNTFNVSSNGDIKKITDKVKQELLAIITDVVPAI